MRPLLNAAGALDKSRASAGLRPGAGAFLRSPSVGVPGAVLRLPPAAVLGGAANRQGLS